MKSMFPMRARSLYTASAQRALTERKADVARLQEHLSTGRKVNRASDDAQAFGQARRLDVLSNRYEQYERSISAARSWTDHTQQALDELAERFTEVYEQGIRGASDTFSEADREKAAVRIEQIRDDVARTLNREIDGEYLFGGTRTDRPPFNEDGTLAAADYDAIGGSRVRQVGPGLEIDLGVGGERLHVYAEGGATITDAMQGLADALRSGDAEQMDEAIGQVQKARDHVIDLGAEAGDTANRLDQARGQLQEAGLAVQGRRSELEDADLAETYLGLQTAQTSLQAALKVTASTLQTTLLDYLR